MNLPFIIVRKLGKLPAETISQEYELDLLKLKGTEKLKNDDVFSLIEFERE